MMQFSKSLIDYFMVISNINPSVEYTMEWSLVSRLQYAIWAVCYAKKLNG